jgi:hypothetical protein
LTPSTKIIAIASGLTLAAGTAFAADTWPQLQRGQWEFQKIVGIQKTVTTKCTNPVDDWKRHSAMMRHAGCKITPVKRAGNVYSYSSVCEAKNTPGSKARSESKTTITVEPGNGAYQLETLSKANDQSSKEFVNARRLGACKK